MEETIANRRCYTNAHHLSYRLQLMQSQQNRLRLQRQRNHVHGTLGRAECKYSLRLLRPAKRVLPHRQLVNQLIQPSRRLLVLSLEPVQRHRRRAAAHSMELFIDCRHHYRCSIQRFPQDFRQFMRDLLCQHVPNLVKEPPIRLSASRQQLLPILGRSRYRLCLEQQLVLLICTADVCNIKPLLHLLRCKRGLRQSGQFTGLIAREQVHRALAEAVNLQYGQLLAIQQFDTARPLCKSLTLHSFLDDRISRERLEYLVLALLLLRVGQAQFNLHTLIQLCAALYGRLNDINLLLFH